eukprot:1140417-Pelagomonas_calceolata.AAC.5
MLFHCPEQSLINRFAYSQKHWLGFVKCAVPGCPHLLLGYHITTTSLVVRLPHCCHVVCCQAATLFVVTKFVAGLVACLVLPVAQAVLHL